MKLQWPQYVWIASAAWALLVAWTNNGKPLDGTHNVHRVALVTIASGVLLWFGGFFGGGVS